MGERKVLNKYIPPDFDPSLVPRIKKKKDDLVQVRMMIPFSMQVSIPSRCAALRRVASRCVVLHCVVLHCVPSCPVLSCPVPSRAAPNSIPKLNHPLNQTTHFPFAWSSVPPAILFCTEGKSSTQRKRLSKALGEPIWGYRFGDST